MIIFTGKKDTFIAIELLYHIMKEMIESRSLETKAINGLIQ